MEHTNKLMLWWCHKCNFCYRVMNGRCKKNAETRVLKLKIGTYWDLIEEQLQKNDKKGVVVVLCGRVGKSEREGMTG